MALIPHFSIGLYYLINSTLEVAFEFNRPNPGRIASPAIVDSFTLSLADLRSGATDASNFIEFLRRFAPDEPSSSGIRQPFTIEQKSDGGTVELTVQINGQVAIDVEWVKATDLGTVMPRPADDLSVEEFKAVRQAFDDWVTECERIQAES